MKGNHPSKHRAPSSKQQAASSPGCEADTSGRGGLKIARCCSSTYPTQREMCLRTGHVRHASHTVSYRANVDLSRRCHSNQKENAGIAVLLYAGKGPSSKLYATSTAVAGVYQASSPDAIPIKSAYIALVGNITLFLTE